MLVDARLLSDIDLLLIYERKKTTWQLSMSVLVKAILHCRMFVLYSYMEA